MAFDSRIGPYRILRLIRSGGQGSVYLGYDERLRRRVAVKIYPLPIERSARKRVLREAQLVASIDSPRVVRIHDVIASSGHVAMVMEYVPGCDLEQLLAGVQLSLASSITVASDVAAAIASARQQRIVHGDLKASNILVTEAGRVKVTDFGIAGVAGEGAHSPAGSLAAASPEQLLGKPLDVRSDLFALGCLLHRMLLGTHAYPDRRQPVLRPLPAYAADGTALPEKLATLLLALLALEPEQRPANTHRVRQILREVASGMPQSLEPALVAEAKASFRVESADDIPVVIPSELQRRGRARFALRADGSRSVLAAIGQRLRQPLVLATVLLVTLAGVAATVLLAPAATRVYVQEPRLRVESNLAVPVQLSGAWLLEQVLHAAGESGLSLEFSGSMPQLRSTSLDRTAGGDQAVDEDLWINLRCSREVCLFGLTRQRGEQSRYMQAVLLPDMPLTQWRDLVYSATRDIYQPGLGLTQN